MSVEENEPKKRKRKGEKSRVREGSSTSVRSSPTPVPARVIKKYRTILKVTFGRMPK